MKQAPIRPWLAYEIAAKTEDSSGPTHMGDNRCTATRRSCCQQPHNSAETRRLRQNAAFDYFRSFNLADSISKGWAMAKVLVWLPSRSSQGGINVGHTALWADRADQPAYVSWWPDGGVNKSAPGTMGHTNNNFESDVAGEEGNLPISVDLTCLNDNLISQWWRLVKYTGFSVPYSLEVLPESNDYELFSNNCSTVVFRGMIIGGGTSIVPFPKFDTVTPPHILLWAKAISITAGVKDWFSMPSSIGKTQ